jgi:hypothetical protein
MVFDANMSRYGSGMLHITNGDSVAGTLRHTGLPGAVVAWQDVLHEGPVPAGLPLEELSRVRAGFLASPGFGTVEQNAASFAQRDRALAGFRDHEEVVLWFEHDLYDQLQLIQVLDWLNGREPGATRLSLICIGEYPGRPRFAGLGELNASQLAGLFGVRHPITTDQLDLGSRAWEAFRFTDPLSFATFAAGDGALPFLAGAVRRLLEQFPSSSNGLSRTDGHVLEYLSEGPAWFADLFASQMEKEERPFLGDGILQIYIDRMIHSKTPLLAVEPDSPAPPSPRCRYSLTQAGRKVLAAEADFVHLNGIDRWIGGTHLHGAESQWRWDAQRQALRRC